MLALSLLSFVGLGGIQSLSYLFEGSHLSINLTLEEESETKTNEEPEDKSEKEIVNYNFVMEDYEHLISTAFHNHLYFKNNLIAEVDTPPPKA